MESKSEQKYFHELLSSITNCLCSPASQSVSSGDSSVCSPTIPLTLSQSSDEAGLVSGTGETQIGKTEANKEKTPAFFKRMVEQMLSGLSSLRQRSLLEFFTSKTSSNSNFSQSVDSKASDREGSQQVFRHSLDGGRQLDAKPVGLSSLEVVDDDKDDSCATSRNGDPYETPGLDPIESKDTRIRDCPCRKWRPHTQTKCECVNFIFFPRPRGAHCPAGFVQSWDPKEPVSSSVAKSRHRGKRQQERKRGKRQGKTKLSKMHSTHSSQSGTTHCINSEYSRCCTGACRGSALIR